MRGLNILIGIFAFALMISFSSASSYIGSGSYITQQTYMPNYQTYYSSSDINTYWPILNEKDGSCEGRQDIMLHVAPAGCQPSVVRSDLLAEQNVPVFCQIDATVLNPLINVNEISDIGFSGSYPEDVIGTGFHPARAALRTRDTLMGSPVVNNIGYVVVVLKKNPAEKDLPDFVSVNLSARIRYDAGNALGIGKAEFILKPSSDAAWNSDKFKQSFWQGRYFVRLEDVDSEAAAVSIYKGDQKLTTVKVKPGESSSDIYIPSSYCQATMKIYFDGMQLPQKTATIEVSDEKGSDRFAVYSGSTFLNGKCRVLDVQASGIGLGNATISCRTTGSLSGKPFMLSLKPRFSNIFVDSSGNKVNITHDNGNYIADFGRAGIYGIDSGNLFYYIMNGVRIERDRIYADAYGNKTRTDWLQRVESAIKEYKAYREEHPENPENILADKDLGKEADSNFSAAVEAYRKIANDYPSEKATDASKAYGEDALSYAIELARYFGKDMSRKALLEEFANKYPGSELANGYKMELQNIYSMDSSLAGVVVEVDNNNKNIRLVDVNSPSDMARATFDVSGIGEIFSIDLNGEMKDVFQNNRTGISKIRLDRVDRESVVITPFCRARGTEQRGSSVILRVGQGYANICETERIRLSGIPSTEEVAKIRILPNVKNTESLTNLTINIGIEKRTIQLSIDETKKKIKTLNDNIEKWQKISDGLANVVKGMKGACFATAGVLTIKNFLSGLSGEAIARNKVMTSSGGWTSKCKDLIVSGKYKTLTECYNGEADNINKDVNAMTKAIEETNQKVKGIEDNNRIENKDSILNSLFGDSVIKTGAAKIELANAIKAECSGNVNMPAGKTWMNIPGKNSVAISDLVSSVNDTSYEDLKAVYTNCKTPGGTQTLKETVDSSFANIADRISQSRVISNAIADNQQKLAQGEPKTFFARPAGQNKINADVVQKVSVKVAGAEQLKSDYAAVVTVPGSASTDGKISFTGGKYLLGLQKTDKGTYIVQEALRFDGAKYANENINVNAFQTTYGIGEISTASSAVYNNKYYNPEIRFFETDPYKGMPEVVPFDLVHGWYAGTKQTLPGLGGGIKTFDSSGRVVSFWICNVGPNGREQFDEGLEDDNCQQINLNTGESTQNVLGLSESESKILVDKAIRALDEAARQYASGVRYIRISGLDSELKVGKPATGTPGAECQDFMSPEDCKLLFNVCDPVICPASRCNLGGEYPVSDVVQTGIVGSILLCLPNIREGIYIPVCLTGIQAGIDSFISVMKNHRDCLQASLDSGQMIGICDQLYSIYLCEFFWRQVAPVANIILPRLITYAYTGGQNARGGGEYLTVMGAWQNMRNSIDYFTQSYGANAFKAFNARSIEEAGGEFCKSFVSVKGPSAIDSLLEPDSPPQYYAWFSSTAFTTATVPATSQYKVFYHIFAGKDSGVYYSVYLKDPPGTSYYATSPMVQVASGFIARGDYASATKDFTAPEGYKQLCIRVNDKEECGFKQVSTDFAVNYVRDVVVKDELVKKDIKGEAACISGTPSAEGALGSAVTNVGAGTMLDEAANPEIYNRGIVRVCATTNPGAGTDPTRFVDVGYCSNEKIRCWLDQKSIDNAITDNNIGVKNATITEMQGIAESQIEKQGYYTRQNGIAEIKGLEDAANSLKGSAAQITTDSAALLQRIDAVKGSLFWNDQKAALLMVRAKILDKIARAVYNEKIGQMINENAPKVAASVPADSGEMPEEEFTGRGDGQERAVDLELDKVKTDSNLKTGIKIKWNGMDSGLYVKGTKVYAAGDREIGQVVNNAVKLNSFTSIMAYIGADLYNALNGATLTDGSTEIGLSSATASSETSTSGTAGTSYTKYLSLLSSTLKGKSFEIVNDNPLSAELVSADLNLDFKSSTPVSAGANPSNLLLLYDGSFSGLYIPINSKDIMFYTKTGESVKIGMLDNNLEIIYGANYSFASFDSNQISEILAEDPPLGLYDNAGKNLEFELQNGGIRTNTWYRFNGKNWEFREGSSGTWYAAGGSQGYAPSEEDVTIARSLTGKSFAGGFLILLKATRDYSWSLLGPSLVTKGVSFSRSYIKGFGNNLDKSATTWFIPNSKTSTLLYDVLTKNGRGGISNS